MLRVRQKQVPLLLFLVSHSDTLPPNKTCILQQVGFSASYGIVFSVCLWKYEASWPLLSCHRYKWSLVWLRYEKSPLTDNLWLLGMPSEIGFYDQGSGWGCLPWGHDLCEVLRGPLMSAKRLLPQARDFKHRVDNWCTKCISFSICVHVYPCKIPAFNPIEFIYKVPNHYKSNLNALYIVRLRLYRNYVENINNYIKI